MNGEKLGPWNPPGRITWNRRGIEKTVNGTVTNSTFFVSKDGKAIDRIKLVAAEGGYNFDLRLRRVGGSDFEGEFEMHSSDHEGPITCQLATFPARARLTSTSCWI